LFAAASRAEPAPPAWQVTLLQRKAGKPSAGLGKTTGWIHRAALKMKRVQMVSGVNYERICVHDGALGLFITHGDKRSDGEVIACDTIVLCAGQEPLREVQAPLEAAGVKVHLVGGAHEAAELDAKRAIDQGTRLAASLWKRQTRREAGLWVLARKGNRSGLRACHGARHLRCARLLLGQGVHTGQRHHRHDGGEAERNGAVEGGAVVHGAVLGGGWCGVDGVNSRHRYLTPRAACDELQPRHAQTPHAWTNRACCL
jgi:hypothetical protein